MAGTDTSTDPSLLKSLKHHLEGLKRTEHGLILYNQIQRGLQKYGHEDGRIELEISIVPPTRPQGLTNGNGA